MLSSDAAEYGTRQLFQYRQVKAALGQRISRNYRQFTMPGNKLIYSGRAAVELRGVGPRRPGCGHGLGPSTRLVTGDSSVQGNIHNGPANRCVIVFGQYSLLAKMSPNLCTMLGPRSQECHRVLRTGSLHPTSQSRPRGVKHSPS